jgi:CubicO group peptidase (beta-lactamase class C family)
MAPAPAKPVASREATAAPRSTLLVDDGAKLPWQIATPEDAGMKRDALAALVEAAETTGSDALLVLRHDRVVVARTFGRPQVPLELMSVTKGFAGIAIGWLLDEGKIASLDAPMSTWFPEWKDQRKARVTLRHVLTHTSGLAHRPVAGELTKQPDRVAYVRALPIESEPGEVFSYNNEATQLLSVVVAAAAGEPIDAYLKRKLFDPLGIERFSWARDRAGNCAIAWGLALSAIDLAKVGITLRDDGMYQGTRVIPSDWIAQMQTPTKTASWHGLLTWLLYDGPWQVQTPERRQKLATQGFTAESKLAPLDGRKFRSRASYWMEAGTLLAPAERDALGATVRDDLLPIGTVDGTLVGWNFNGWLGQYLVVYPSAGVVAVRQRREPKDVTDDDNAQIGMKTFPDLVRAAFP